MLGTILTGLGICLLIIIVFDLTQKKHAILRNFPVVGHFRYLLETIGPELRQYIVTSNNEERPFSRDERRWLYASSKRENNYFGFGTDNDLELSPNFLIIKHSSFPIVSPHPGEPDFDPDFKIPCAKIMGGYSQRKKAFRPSSVVNVSGMSFGSLGGNAVEALNAGCKIAGCMQNTGEGSISPYHLQGGDLVWQIGTNYFGCRDLDGNFSMSRLVDVISETPQVKAIEIKLSQGAKPGLGGLLPKEKITEEIATIRGIPMDKDCHSPSAHVEFHDADSLLDFVEKIADETGLPVGIKSAIGETDFWEDLARLISTTGRTVDFITVDGGEGGSGAAPLVFSDHVALPFKQGFSRVCKILNEWEIDERIVLIGSGKLGFPEAALFSFVLGCDMIAVAREAMMSIGCIQAQRCHTNHCPAGIATQNRWLQRGLDPTLKSVRLANYIITLRKELLALCRACGEPHPSLINSRHLEIIDDRFGSINIENVFGYREGYGMPSHEDQAIIRQLMYGDVVHVNGTPKIV